MATKKKLTETQKKAKRKKALTKNGGLLDKAWTKAGHLGGKCEYCGKTKGLNFHHIFSRSNKSTRWDLDNGVLLCAYHHVFSHQFSAHKTPMLFADWIKELRGEDWYKSLRFRASVPFKPSIQELEDLLKKLKSLS